MSAPPTDDAEARTKHLEMLQGVINRMAQNSFHAKGWSLTLVSALIAFTADGKSWVVTLVALVPAIVFWVLDGFYLWQERLFRLLYEGVNGELGPAAQRAIGRFSMKTGVLGTLSTAEAVEPAHRARIARHLPRRSATWSDTVLWFHGALVAVAVGAVLLGHLGRSTSPTPTAPPAPASAPAAP